MENNQNNEPKKLFKKFSRYKSSKTEEEKKINYLNHIKEILEKDCKNRTKLENHTLSLFLIDNYKYFKNYYIDLEKIEKISSVLKLEKFLANEIILHKDEEQNKLFLVFSGSVGYYKIIDKKKSMKLKDFIIFLSEIKQSSDFYKYNRLIEKNSAYNFDYNQLLSLILDNKILKKEYDFYIEEEEQICIYNYGYFFGENSLINNIISDYNIKSMTTSYLITLDKKDYKKINSLIMEKKLQIEVENFKYKHPMFNSFSNLQIVKMFNYMKEINLTKGEYLYKQNEISDSIYIIKSGSIEIFSLISFGWISDFFDYIINSNVNIVNILLKNKKQYNEEELKKIYENLIQNIEKSPCKYNPNKLSDNIIRSSRTNKNTLNIFNENENIKDDFSLYKFDIKILNQNDIVGLEDSLELKQRFYCAKCISENAIIKKINLYDFFYILNKNNEKKFKEQLINIIAEKKSLLYKQLLNCYNLKKNFLMEKFDYKLDKYINKYVPDKVTKIVLNKLKNEIYNIEEIPPKTKQKILDLHININDYLLPKKNNINNNLVKILSKTKKINNNKNVKTIVDKDKEKIHLHPKKLNNAFYNVSLPFFQPKTISNRLRKNTNENRNKNFTSFLNDTSQPSEIYKKSFYNNKTIQTNYTKFYKQNLSDNNENFIINNDQSEKDFQINFNKKINNTYFDYKDNIKKYKNKNNIKNLTLFNSNMNSNSNFIEENNDKKDIRYKKLKNLLYSKKILFSLDFKKIYKEECEKDKKLPKFNLFKN